jgi:hypothetical protein
MLLALIGTAFANGLTSHQWITLQAIADLPDGDLRAFLEREDLRPYLLNGALFPDGGYAVGDDYGEMAHWEPFQMHYLDWILANDPGDEYAAFLFGMESHGMGDQTFDSMFMERSRVYDADVGWAAGESMDTATDVALSAAEGPGTVPDVWFPEVFPQLFAEQGHEVSADTITQGTTLAGVAIDSVGVWGTIPSTVETYNQQFPWATGHIVDPLVPCSPICEAKVVAAYWQVLWDRLHGGDGWENPVIATIPEDGSYDQPWQADTPESRLAIVMARGLDPDTVTPGVVSVTAPDGADVPVDLSVFYGYASHVILVSPPGGWMPGTQYTVTVHPGIMTFDGLTTTSDYTFSFATWAPSPEDTGPYPKDYIDEDEGCGCASGGGPWGGLAAVGLIGWMVAGRRRK